MSEGWRPIESAPKDGTKIVLHFPGPWPRDVTEMGASVGQWTGSYWWCSAIWAASGAQREPTHWMPLPSPPATTSCLNTPPRDKTRAALDIARGVLIGIRDAMADNGSTHSIVVINKVLADIKELVPDIGETP